jgi:hypothetical protein
VYEHYVRTACALGCSGGLSTDLLLQLWHRYLQERERETTGLNKQALNNCYERALVTMHKMPRIWIEYIQSLMQQGFVTLTRRTLDRALAALPVTQHDRLWIIYLKFVTQPDMPMDTAFRVYRRYLKCVLSSPYIPCFTRPRLIDAKRVSYSTG